MARSSRPRGKRLDTSTEQDASTESRITHYKPFVVALLLSSCFFILRRDIHAAGYLSAPAADATVRVVFETQSEPVTKSPFQHVPCQVSQLSNSPENTTRFQYSETTSWKCRQEISDTYTLVFLDFEIKECPPNYASSAFQLEASTPRSRIMGEISDRYHFKGGCGLYNASVAIMDQPLPPEESTLVADIGLFWTTEFKKYSNHLQDIQDAHTIKAEELPTDQIKNMFTQERLRYLQRHLLPLFQRQIRISFAQPQNQQPQQPTPPLPDCGTIPMAHWEPGGVFLDHAYNDSSHYHPKGTPVQTWPFRTARCSFPPRTLPQMNDLLAGLRILMLGDSHGGNILNEVRCILCPEYSNANWDAYYPSYDCPFRNNSFSYAYRFFRGTFQADMVKDMDHLSKFLRSGTDDACERMLGLGLHNATIITMPHWIMVYETQEGIDDFVLAIKSLLINCRESHAELMEDHVILLQSPTARDYLPVEQGSQQEVLDLNPAHSWRGIHNYRLEAVTQQIKRELSEHVDGIIPIFGMTLARMKTEQTRDGVHLQTSDYREILHIQLAAVRSALKSKRGLDLPMMKADDPKARWFAGQPFLSLG